MNIRFFFREVQFVILWSDDKTYLDNLPHPIQMRFKRCGCYEWRLLGNSHRSYRSSLVVLL